MFAVIDCGTTNTRIFIVRDGGSIVARGEKKVGVRDTSITGSNTVLKNGIEELYKEILCENSVLQKEVSFAIASGMITSEIGLVEIPHLVAPCGIHELSDNIEIVNDPKIIDLGVPVYFVHGVRNNYGDATVRDLRRVDFMRGEEVQCIGILQKMKPELPVNVVVFSSHTKYIHIDENKKIAHCLSTISGQVYEALKTSTNIGKSMISKPNESLENYSFEEIANMACECVNNAGIVRTMMMPRFMELLLKTTGAERDLFVNAAIACDDMRAFDEFIKQGNESRNYVLFGHESRCKMFEYMVNKAYGSNMSFRIVSDKNEISAITVEGAIAVAKYTIAENVQLSETFMR